MQSRRLLPGLLALALLLPVAAISAPATPAAPKPAAAKVRGAELPAWEQLNPEQRELLIAPLRERWNSSPQERVRMYEHAQRWKTLPPEERERARRGMRRFEDMSPAQREQARAIFHYTRDLPAEQRQAFRERWSKMTPEQRQQWLREHPAPAKKD
ncbi:DUF3106 domain-containing protein [Pseudoxanthomonas sp. J35]|uniref:DUF3106 domain-containing protein n=1 Tax=Pseudoxanthomonas sp. J35 TaxID=935852 RepID=UPI000490765C|nr:DUF3106 domain-containing protein [Pseudoxanthomonas sp. J35]